MNTTHNLRQILLGRALLGAWILLAIGLGGCGWQLRGAHGYGGPSTLQLLADEPYAPLAQALGEAMVRSRLREADDAEWQLHLGREILHKRTVAVTSIGSPSQYELSLSTRFYYRQNPANGDGGLAPLARTLSVERVFDYDPSNTVAKREEENALLDEMRSELAQRILLQAPRQR